MEYIDAEKLRAEIESRMEDCKLPNGTFPTTTSIVRYEELSCLRNFITSLQQEQPEVDLEKEINNLDNTYFNLDGIAVIGATYHITVEDLKDIARHFYELGFNAKKK